MQIKLKLKFRRNYTLYTRYDDDAKETQAHNTTKKLINALFTFLFFWARIPI